MFFQSMDPSWQQLLASSKDLLEQIERQVANLEDLAPGPDQVMRAFELPVEKVRVLVLGQDPYPTDQMACGLAFAHTPGTKTPQSLKNMMKELNDDLPEVSTQGDLANWTSQGVFLLNSALTTIVGASGAHQQIWREFIEEVITSLDRACSGKLVCLSLGVEAKKLAGLIELGKVVHAPHPSPLSAHRGFFWVKDLFTGQSSANRKRSRTNRLVLLGVIMTKKSFSFKRLFKAGNPDALTPFSESFLIRHATTKDCQAICDIYNFYINESVITFDEQAMQVSAWEEKLRLVQELKLPFIVATSESGDLAGFAYLAPWRQKSAYRKTAENTIYLKQGVIGQGLGPRLLAELLRRGKDAGINEVVAVISDSDADTSIKMHKKFGFKKAGHLPRVGFKFNRWLGVILMQKSL